MATQSAVAHAGTHPDRRKRVLVGFAVGALVLVVALVALVLLWSGVTLAGDSTALAHVSVQPLGGSIERVQAFGPNGKAIPISVQDGRLTPTERLHPGERVSVEVDVRRPGWIGWALGHVKTEHLTLQAPV